MIKIIKGNYEGPNLNELGYIEKRKVIGKIVLPITRFLRAINTEKYITKGERLLDIGCGDGYFLRRSKCTENYGVDKLFGDNIVDKLDFPDSYFDYVTMLAVIEHLEQPEKIIREIHRILKPGGKLIFTTPKEQAEILIKLYIKNIEDEHESYFTLERVKDLSKDLFELEAYHTFIFGLNQVFCLRKK